MPDRGPRNGSTSRYRKARAAVLAASRTCHVCGHDQDDATDHIKAWARGGSDHATNLAPIHHRPCPTCHVSCNMQKGTKDQAPVIRRSGSLQPPP